MSQGGERPVIADEAVMAELVARLDDDDPAALAEHAGSRGLLPPDDRPGWQIGADLDDQGEVCGLVWYYPVEVREPDRVPVAADGAVLERLWAYLDTHDTTGLTDYARQLGVDPPPGRSDWRVLVVRLAGEPGPGLYWQEPGPPPGGGSR
jgi:hypothetical protein